MSEVQKYHRGILRVLPHPICLISTGYGGAVSSSLLALMVMFTPVLTVEFCLVSGLPYYVKWDFTEEKVCSTSGLIILKSLSWSFGNQLSKCIQFIGNACSFYPIQLWLLFCPNLPLLYLHSITQLLLLPKSSLVFLWTNILNIAPAKCFLIFFYVCLWDLISV